VQDNQLEELLENALTRSARTKESIRVIALTGSCRQEVGEMLNLDLQQLAYILPLPLNPSGFFDQPSELLLSLSFCYC